MGTQEAMEIGRESSAGSGFGAKTDVMNKIKREKYKVDELLDRQAQEENWNFKNEYNEAANEYRRKMVPFYLLGEESD